MRGSNGTFRGYATGSGPAPVKTHRTAEKKLPGNPSNRKAQAEIRRKLKDPLLKTKDRKALERQLKKLHERIV